MTPVDLSVVIPVYNAESTIAEVVHGLVKGFAGRGAMQIVLVNDGSRDGSHEVCAGLADSLPDTVTYLRLAKNFGEHNAVMAGLRAAVGAYVVIMDDDGQNPPECAMRLYEGARAGAYDLFYSKYAQKQHHWFRNLGSRINGFAANFMLDKPKDLYLSSFKCLSQWMVREIVRYNGPFPYIDGLALRCTRNIGTLELTHQPRANGRSGYTLRKLIGLWLNMAINFSVMPLRASTFLGLGLVACGFVMSAVIIFEKLAGHAVPAGWPFLAITAMLFSGTQLLMLGMIGEYLGRLFLMQNETPQSVVRERRGYGSREWQKTHERITTPA